MTLFSLKLFDRITVLRVAFNLEFVLRNGFLRNTHQVNIPENEFSVHVDLQKMFLYLDDIFLYVFKTGTFGSALK